MISALCRNSWQLFTVSYFFQDLVDHTGFSHQRRAVSSRTSTPKPLEPAILKIKMEKQASSSPEEKARQEKGVPGQQQQQQEKKHIRHDEL